MQPPDGGCHYLVPAEAGTGLRPEKPGLWPVQTGLWPVQLASGQFQLASAQSQLASGQSQLGYTQLNFSQLQRIKIKIKETCFLDSDNGFDTPLHYTETIFMEIQHFHSCGDTTIQHANPSLEWNANSSNQTQRRLHLSNISDSLSGSAKDLGLVLYWRRELSCTYLWFCDLFFSNYN